MICDTKAKNYSFIIEILVITAWIGLLWWYTKFAVFDSFTFYDAEHNYHLLDGEVYFCEVKPKNQVLDQMLK